MPMPVDIVLVRHGESEGNVAHRRADEGDLSDFTPAFRARHSSRFRLTDRGREQARIAGEWIRRHVGTHFDRYYVSEYLRAMETAALLGMPDASWYADFFLRERDAGHLEGLTEEEQFTRFPEAMEGRELDAFYWSPPGGESLASLCLRIDRILDILRRELPDRRVLLVCHGEVMRAFQVRIERPPQRRYLDLHRPRDPRDEIHNCQVFHYTRRNPERSDDVAQHIAWFRSTCPWDEARSRNAWVPVERPRYSNEDLLAAAAATERLISG